MSEEPGAVEFVLANAPKEIFHITPDHKFVLADDIEVGEAAKAFVSLVNAALAPADPVEVPPISEPRNSLTVSADEASRDRGASPAVAVDGTDELGRALMGVLGENLAIALRGLVREIRSGDGGDAIAAHINPPAATDSGIEEAALALMQIPGGPGVLMRGHARVAIEAYLRVTHPAEPKK